MPGCLQVQDLYWALIQALVKAVELVKIVVQVLPQNRLQLKAAEAVQKLLRHQPPQAAEPVRNLNRLSQHRLVAEAAVNSAVCTISDS